MATHEHETGTLIAEPTEVVSQPSGRELTTKQWLARTALSAIAAISGMFASAAYVAEVEAFTHDGAVDDTAHLIAQSPTSHKPGHQSKPVTVTSPPAGNYDPNITTLTCHPETVRIHEGNTIYGLTTAGLARNDYMTNWVFQWNLEEIAKQAETDPALQNPSDIPIEHKVSILRNCAMVGWTWRDWEYGTDKNPVYERDVTYQDFHGTDGQVHHDVTVTYVAERAGKITNQIVDCRELDCLDYVPVP